MSEVRGHIYAGKDRTIGFRRVQSWYRRAGEVKRGNLEVGIIARKKSEFDWKFMESIESAGNEKVSIKLKDLF